MGREVRLVPEGWEHPKNPRKPDRFQPMHDQSLREAIAAWQEERAEFIANPPENYDGTADEWHGDHPKGWAAYYRPDWPDEECTHFQLYEDTTEGTPKSPVFATREELLDWVLTVGVPSGDVTAFGDMPGSDDYWRRVIVEGIASFGMILTLPAGTAEPA